MKRRSPLQVLARLRSIRERKERSRLGTALAGEAEARAKLARLRTDQAAALRPHERLSPVQLRTLHLQGIRSEELIAQAALAHEEARRRALEAGDRWRRAAADADAAEKLEARRREQAAFEAGRAAERSLDDLMGVLRVRRPR